MPKGYTLSGANDATIEQIDDMFKDLYDSMGATTHALLSATHPDTTPGSPTRGDLIVAQGTTTTWKKFAIGAANRVLRSDGTDVAWGLVVLTTDISGVLPIANGGTNLTNYTQGDLLYASATDVLATLAKNTTATRYLSNTGASNAPAWAQVNLANGVTGTLKLGNGGTGLASVATGDMLYYGGTVGQFTPLTIGASNTFLKSDGPGVGPSWSGFTLPTSVAVGDIWYGSTTSAIAALAKSATATRYLSNTGASNIPAWAQVNLANGVTGVLPFANLVNASAISVLVGRGAAAGAGVFQEVTLGTGLTMTGTVLSAAGGSGVAAPHTPGGRLTLTTAVPVTTADVTAAGTLYYTPADGSTVWLYDGSTTWTEYALTERSLALTLTSGKNYDVFLYITGGTLTLELSAAWTNDTTRADALVLQDGMYVKSGATTRLWLGTLRASGSNTTESSFTRRLLWNRYNQVRLILRKRISTFSWTYTTNVFRQANADTANQVELVCGQLGFGSMELLAAGYGSNAVAHSGQVNIGEDSTSSPMTVTVGIDCADTGNFIIAPPCWLHHSAPLGWHFYAQLERSQIVGATSWFGDDGSNTLHSGMTGFIMG